MALKRMAHRNPLRLAAWCVALAACLIAGCAGVAPRSASVSGSASYRERIALPPDAVFEATLEEVPGADAPALVLASTRVASPRVPIAFTIAYDPSRIEPGKRYAVRGRISVNGQLMFTSDSAQPVLGPSGTRPVEMLLRRVAGSAVAGEPRRMVGLYRYMADAASFFDCASGDQFPIAPDGDGPALQAAYVESRAVPGEPQLVSLDARVVMRAPEPGGAPRPALQVERVIALSAQSQCTAANAAPTLESSYWKLASLRGQPAVASADRQREAHLILQPAQRRVVGSSGCNRLSGNYTLDGDRLTFARSVGTMVACREGMQQERSFLDALALVARWRIEGRRLTLLDERGAALLQFEAVVLR